MCEAIFELFGTSSEEIAENATREANLKIQALSDRNTALSNEISVLKARILELEKRAVN